MTVGVYVCVRMYVCKQGNFHLLDFVCRTADLNQTISRNLTTNHNPGGCV